MAARIRILSENLSNKIAAGEVVERPASVVKEMVENSLDAGASEIVVEIEAGGRRLIKVSDNGCGMSREDALLALERHATSKIVTDDDLLSISTLGFRGEALPSIASVCRLTLSSREKGSVEGTEIYAEGGVIRNVKARGMADGTIVEVRNLFFNTPARLKFMKSAETEAGHVADHLTRLALSRPDVRFVYLNDGRVVFRALKSDLQERALSLLGRSMAAQISSVDREDGGMRLHGLAARPECSRSVASHLYTFVNGRFVRDRVLQHAVLQDTGDFWKRGAIRSRRCSCRFRPAMWTLMSIPPSTRSVSGNNPVSMTLLHQLWKGCSIQRRGNRDPLRKPFLQGWRVSPWLKEGSRRCGTLWPHIRPGHRSRRLPLRRKYRSAAFPSLKMSRRKLPRRPRTLQEAM